MVDIDLPKERRLFGGVVRPLRKEDIILLKPILSTWIKDRDTGRHLPDEVDETLQTMSDSAHGRNDRVYFVAESSEGEVIGVIGYKTPDQRMLPFTKTPKPAELVNAYVANEWTGKGTGKALVMKLENDAGNKGYTEVVLNSGPRYKDTGWGFYDKLEGYQRAGVAEGYYGEGGDAPVWRKEL